MTGTGYIEPANTLRRSSLAYDIIKERLLEGQWAAGEHISIAALKTELGVSKQPIMDAVRRLSAEGLVDVIPQVGCRVPVFTMDETVDFFNIFASLEAEATAVAARRRTGEQVDALLLLNQKIRGLADISDPIGRIHGYLMFNRRFHRVILEMSHSSVVLRLSSRMWDVCDLLINTQGRSRPLADEIIERHGDHERIISALSEVDVGVARAEMHAHITRNIAMLEKSQVSREGSTFPSR